MRETLPASPSAFDGQASYRIDVQGRIPARWCERLEGMTITVTAPEAGPLVTTLLGELSDQAALAGVLRTLYELHLPVVSVQRLSAGTVLTTQLQQLAQLHTAGVLGDEEFAAAKAKLLCG